VLGNTAKIAPARRPTRGFASRLPIAATSAVVPIMASSDGSRSATSVPPTSSVQPRSST
jgi:hypothetical protein